MKYRALANYLLDRVTRSSTPHVQAGEMNSLGPEALGEAFRLRWLAPDTDTGGLLIANSAQVMAQLREVAGGNFKSLGGDVVLDAEEEEDAKVGDEVVVSINGQPVKARVKAVNPDGTLALDYQNASPSTKPVKPNEVRITSRPVPKSEPPRPGFSSQPVGATVPAPVQ